MLSKSTTKGTIIWPEGKAFAFTVFDDTDNETLQNTKPVYDFLAEQGYRTTKSVWTIQSASNGQTEQDGSSCEDAEYRDWVLQLKQQGFEIGLHNVASRTSSRERTRLGLDRFRHLFDQDPITMSNHVVNREGIYFGAARLSAPQRWVYAAFARAMGHKPCAGHIPSDPLFWGDLCKRHVKYVRNFVFADINTLKACPNMPYHDPARPFVNYWFASSEGQGVDSFNATISERNQDRLAREGGACIMYTHFAGGFSKNGCLNARFESLMRRLAKLNGWFVPVGSLLDFLIVEGHEHQLSLASRMRLELRWLTHKLRVGPT